MATHQHKYPLAIIEKDITRPNNTTQIHPPSLEASATSGGSPGGGRGSTSSPMLEGKTMPIRGRMVVGLRGANFSTSYR